jgi:hypothetical protein
MNTWTHQPNHDIERPSGVPRPGRLGDSKKEFWALLAAGGAIIAIALAFWLEATQ